MSNPKALHAPQPRPTDPEIFEHGTPVWVVTGPRSQTVEEWVRGIVGMTGFRIDWRQIGGRCVVLVLGGYVECAMAQAMIRDQMEALRDQYMACTYNWSKDPQRSDVVGRPLDIEETVDRSVTP